MRATVILGSAPCWAEDFSAIPMPRDGRPVDIIAVNCAALRYLGPIKHWVSQHGRKMVDWQRERDLLGGEAIEQLDTTDPGGPAGCRLWRVGPEWRTGSSGMLAVLLAVHHWDYRRIVLAGMPIAGDRSLQVGDQVERYQRGAIEHWQRQWLRRIDELAAYTRSMSGWTREQLGAPGPAWLSGGD